MSNGTRRWIPAPYNNWQGGCLSKHFKKTFGSTLNPDFINIDERFVVLLAGWDCETNLPDSESLIGLLNSTSTRKRDVITSGVTINGGAWSFYLTDTPTFCLKFYRCTLLRLRHLKSQSENGRDAPRRSRRRFLLCDLECHWAHRQCHIG